LPPDTTKYFMRLSGHDTLRFILAKRVILVEGPSDELIVQKAYTMCHGKSPLEHGTEVIAVNSLAFKRFLHIAQKLDVDVRVVTDNDGDPSKVIEKYKEFNGNSNIKVYFDGKDVDCKTLEPQLLKANGLTVINAVLGKKYLTSETLLKYMSKNKTECALRIFESEEVMKYPEYIERAITL